VKEVLKGISRGQHIRLEFGRHLTSNSVYSKVMRDEKYQYSFSARRIMKTKRVCILHVKSFSFSQPVR
jgi:hypothetical protein